MTQADFDAAAAIADQSRVARFGYRLWHVNGIPTRVRVWGMGLWNRRYREALWRLDEPRRVDGPAV